MNFLGRPGLTLVNPSDPGSNHYTGSDGSYLKTKQFLWVVFKNYAFSVTPHNIHNTNIHLFLHFKSIVFKKNYFFFALNYFLKYF